MQLRARPAATAPRGRASSWVCSGSVMFCGKWLGCTRSVRRCEAASLYDSLWFMMTYIIYIIWAISCCFFCINMSMSILSITINLSPPRFYWTWTSLPRCHCSTFVSLLEGTILWTCEAAGLLHSRLGTQDIPFWLTASCNIPTAQCGRTWKDLVSWQRMETKDKDGMGWFNFPCLEAWTIRGLWRRWRLNHSLNKFQKLHIVTGEICSIDCNIHWYSHYN